MPTEHSFDPSPFESSSHRSPAPSSKRSILLVDANPDHLPLIADAFSQGSSHHVFSVDTVDAALAFVQQQAPYEAMLRPDLIVLDLELPDGQGHIFLKTLKETPILKRIPVVILTLSDEPDAIFESYARQGNCYVLKSQELEQLPHIVQQIKSFWLEIVTLPIS